MSVKVMIIDGQADFRRLLSHHVSAHWPDATVNEYDPVSTGMLPDAFSGAGNDLVLLGDNCGAHDSLRALRRFTGTPGFPPVIYFTDADSGMQSRLRRHGAHSVVGRRKVRHASLIVAMSDALRSRQHAGSTSSLFVGDMRAGIQPLIRGYRFGRRLSTSGHSAVYVATKEGSDRKIVLKVLRQVPDRGDAIGAFDRFLREYELIADLHHPNIVRIFDLGVGDDHAHIAMEYLSGGDLKQRLLTGLSVEQAVGYTRQIASALAEIHRVGILHRDLKPGNIMLRDDDSIALIDFGLAKHMRLEQEITDSGEIFGTPYYMSPEQGHGNNIDERSDIYSLGVIFYEMLTGDKPFRAGNAMGIIFKHANAPIPLLPARLAQFQALINLMLAKTPDDRLADAGEVLEWL